MASGKIKIELKTDDCTLEVQKSQPISNIKWIDVETLNANDYNPNTVLTPEMNLLKFSILKTGWIQPIIIGTDNVIIDGFHRYWLSLHDKDMLDKFKGMAPVVIMDLSVPERMLLTVRINRAKGVHAALKMHELVTTVFKEHGYPKEEIAKQIGAGLDEVELLLQEGVFTKINIKDHKYSQSWTPTKS